jgi:hypothetical protein
MQQEPWWISYVNALSTAAVALFALVEILGARSNRIRRARLAHTRIGAYSDGLHQYFSQQNKTFPVDVLPHLSRPATTFDVAAVQAWLHSAAKDFDWVQRQIIEIVDEAGNARGKASDGALAATKCVMEAVNSGRWLAQELSDPEILPSSAYILTWDTRRRYMDAQRKLGNLVQLTQPGRVLSGS